MTQAQDNTMRNWRARLQGETVREHAVRLAAQRVHGERAPVEPTTSEPWAAVYDEDEHKDIWQ